jgi:hypothetical protein
MICELVAIYAEKSLQNLCCDRLELPADFGGGFGLDVVHVHVGRAAAEEDLDDG